MPKAKNAVVNVFFIVLILILLNVTKKDGLVHANTCVIVKRITKTFFVYKNQN